MHKRCCDFIELLQVTLILLSFTFYLRSVLIQIWAPNSTRVYFDHPFSLLSRSRSENSSPD